MVIYDLVCSHGHQFEGWFPGFEAFQRQLEQGHVVCHVCGDAKVTKVVSGGHFMGSHGQEPASESQTPSPKPNEGTSALAASAKIDAVTFIKAIQRYVTQNFENVGERFPRLIREMHAGKTEERNICGRISPEEQEKLAEDEIPHMLLPDLPPEYDN